MSKKIIQYTESVWCDYAITECKTLGSILETVQSLIQSYGKDTKINFDANYESISEYLYVIKEREETDAEYKARMKQEKKQVDKERKEYERLRAKFGDNK